MLFFLRNYSAGKNIMQEEEEVRCFKEGKKK